MPLLEAMACGTPVSRPRASALPEVAGDAALFAPPDDVSMRGPMRCGVSRGRRIARAAAPTTACGAPRKSAGKTAPSTSRSVSRRGDVIRLGVDAWNLPGDRRGIGRYLRAILREWFAAVSRAGEVALVVPQWHTWTTRGRIFTRGWDRPYAIVSRRLHSRAGLNALWFPFNGCS